jgi:hypothetical protein
MARRGYVLRNSLTESEVDIVRVDERAEPPVALYHLDLVEHRVCIDVCESRNPAVVVGSRQISRYVHEQVSGADQRGPCTVRHAEPRIITQAEAVRPAILQTEPCHDFGQIAHGAGAIGECVAARGIVRPGTGVFDVMDIVAETGQAEDVLQVMPGHAAERVLRDHARYDDAERGAHRAPAHAAERIASSSDAR